MGIHYYNDCDDWFVALFWIFPFIMDLYGSYLVYSEDKEIKLLIKKGLK